MLPNKEQMGFTIPEDSPKRQKAVFFKDEEDVLKLIKHENITQLNEYIDSNGICDGLFDRFLGYTVSMVKPSSFKTLCLRDMSKIPGDVMHRLFHTVLCETQDESVTPERLQYLEIAITQIYEFLEEYDQLNKDDVMEALEIYYDYEESLKNVLGTLVSKITTKQSVV